MKFTVEKEIFEKLPNACFGVVVAKGIDNSVQKEAIDEFLEEGIISASSYFAGKKVKEDPAILPYREAFRSLGSNPNKYMCSVEALFTRIAKGKGMPHINPIVDLGNAVSLKYTLPIGAHDLDSVPTANDPDSDGAAGGISIRLSRERDTFLPFGAAKEETLDPGEVVYAAGSQIRTRRWTWRQSEHGKIGAETSYVFFPIDGFGDFNRDSVIAARDELDERLRVIFGCRTLVGYVDASSPEMSLDI